MCACEHVCVPTRAASLSGLQELGLIRKPASFMTSICDERGQELLYAGVPITNVFEEDLGIGGVLGLLWFQRRCVRPSLVYVHVVQAWKRNP